MGNNITDINLYDQQAADGQAALEDKAAHSVKWALLYNVVPRLVTPFSTIILGVLLTPVDFGLVAINTFIVALARVVIDPGLGKALIQRSTNDIDDAASLSFLFNLLISMLLYLGLWLASPVIAHAYDQEQVVIVIRVGALALPLTALTTTPKSLLRRNMEFNKLFWIYSSFLILQAIASVILAALGWGAMSIIWGQLFGMLVSVILSWWLVKWWPKLSVKWSVFRSMLRFGIWVIAWSFQEWLFFYADNIIAGLFLGVQGLGIYSLGFNIASLVSGLLVFGLGDVAYSAFCKMQNNPAEIGQKLVQLQKITATLLFPVAFGIAAIASTFINLLYGQKWAGLGMVIAILVIMPGLSSLWSFNTMAFQAINKPDISTKLSGVSLLVLLPLLWFAASFGLTTFTWVRFGAAWLLPLGNILWSSKVLSISIREQVKIYSSSLLLSGIMFIVVSKMIYYMGQFQGIIGWAKLLAVIVVGGLTYLIPLRVTNLKLWDQTVTGIKRTISK